MKLKEVEIDKCPYCRNTNFVKGFQTSGGRVVKSTFVIGQNLHHIICSNCGSIVRSYVKNPNKLKK